MKYLIVSLFFLVLVSCKKQQEVNAIDTYGEKITGTWTCDSIVKFNPNSDTIVYWTEETAPYMNEAFTYDTTDTVPKTFVFLKTTGVNMYKWNEDVVEIFEDTGRIYKEGPLGDAGESWYITHIDANTCVLKLDYSPAPGLNIISQRWYYLSR